MALSGMGTEQIAARLSKEHILSPTFYWQSKGINRSGKGGEKNPYHWNNSTVIKMLGLQEYCGDVINFKTYSKSYKNKKRMVNDEENRAVFKDVHEPIIARAVWEKVQSKRGKMRKRRTNEGEKNMFSGLLVCADCGHNCITTSIRVIPTSGISTAPTIRATAGRVHRRITSALIFWKRSCWGRYAA